MTLSNLGKKIELQGYSNADALTPTRVDSATTTTTTTTTAPATPTTTSVLPTTTPVKVNGTSVYSKPIPRVPSGTTTRVATPIYVPVPTPVLSAPPMMGGGGGGGGGMAEEDLTQKQQTMETKNKSIMVTGLSMLAGAAAGYFVAKGMKKNKWIGAAIGAGAVGVAGYITYTKFVFKPAPKADEKKSEATGGVRNIQQNKTKVGGYVGTSGGVRYCNQGGYIIPCDQKK